MWLIIWTLTLLVSYFEVRIGGIFTIRLAVDDSYDGPRINEETKTVDAEFVKAMIARFKDQKKIHKKYAFMVRPILLKVIQGKEY